MYTVSDYGDKSFTRFRLFAPLFLVVFNILIFLNKSAFLPLEAKRGHFLF